jgi:hypothetical protein
MVGYDFAQSTLRIPRHLLKPLDQPLALEAGQPLDPEQAVELIDLMLVTNRAQAVGFLGLKIAVDVPIADPHPRVTPDVVVDAGHRDAAFLMQDGLRRGPDDLRIDVGPRAIDEVEIEHHHPQGDADMWRGDADARCCVHRFQQIAGEVAQRVVERSYGLRRQRKPGVGIADDRADGHVICR